MIDEKKIGAAFFSAALSLVFTGYITAMISLHITHKKRNVPE